jgi:hypothetical protein
MLTKDEITAKLRAGEITAEEAVEALQAQDGRQPCWFRVGDKGALSIYFEGCRFPVSLFIECADELFTDQNVARVREFINAHRGEFKTQAQKRAEKEKSKKR